MFCFAYILDININQLFSFLFNSDQFLWQTKHTVDLVLFANSETQK